MDVVQLEKLKSKKFKTQKLSFGNSISAEKLLVKPQNFLLAARSCDGSFHSVNSDIVKILKKKKDIIRKGIVGDVVTELSLDETLHGQRFVIFDLKKGNVAYLLGDVATALKKLSTKT